jgi:hypothetical protein
MEGYAWAELVASGDAVLPGFGAVAGMLAELVCGLAGRGAGTLAEIEDRFAADGREVLRAGVQLVLDARAAGEKRLAAVTGADGVARRRAERGHGRVITTVFGEVTVRRIAYRAPGCANLYPLDAALNLPACCYSWRLQHLAVMFARDGAYQLAQEFVQATTGVTVGKRQLEQIVAAAAGDVAAFYDIGGPAWGRPPCGPQPDGREPGLPPAGPAPPPLALSADGKGVAMRPESRRKRSRAPGKRVKNFGTRPGIGEKGHKRIAETACVCEVSPRARTPEQVMASHHGGSGKKAGKPAPQSLNRRYRVDIAADRSAAISWLFEEAGRRDPGHARDWVVLVDGDNHQINLIEQQAAARGITRVTILIDLIHVLEYLWKAAWAFHQPRDPAIETWTIAQATDILHGRTAEVTARIRKLAEQHPPAGTEHAKNIRKTLSYLQAKQPYLDHYPRALAAGWPVATGVIEGACRHLVKDRMGITGARWSTSGAQAILWLRVIHANHDHAAYWHYHTQQEHQRNHLNRYHNKLTLAA